MEIIAVIQARFSSSRLPGKVLKNILGKPMLQHQIERIQRCKNISKIIVATSTQLEDDKIENLCQQLNISCFRGDLNDVLDRFYQVNKLEQAKHIVRLTADCPLLDPVIIDKVITTHLNQNSDYTSNCSPATFPDGLDVEIFTHKALNQSWQEAQKPSEREHVTQYMRNHPELFSLNNVSNDIDYSHLRWTVDESEDFELITEIFKSLYPVSAHFCFNDILTLIKAQPQLSLINQKYTRNEGLAKSINSDKELGYE